jgi:short-subunit dehydrogenase
LSNPLSGMALVTGASSGIGRAVAELLAARGMRLVLTGRDADRLSAVAAELQGRARAIVIPADLGDEAAVATLASRVASEAGGLSALVHAAGAVYLGPLADATAAQLDELYRVNLRAPFLLTRGLLPTLRAARGQVVFVNSTAGLLPGAGNGLYAATKHALAALARSLRDEVNRDGIRVLSVFPGRTATPMQERVSAFEGIRYHPERLLQPGDVAEIIVDTLALPATAEVTDVVVRPRMPPGPYT